MTETTPASDVPNNVGRNDPCPCGSGEKYKKCCMQTHRVQKEAQKTSRRPEQLIGEQTAPWRMYKLIEQMRENNMPNLFWESSHELGPWRASYPTREAYFEALGNGSEQMVAREGFDLLRIRHDGPDVLLLLVRGHEDPHRSTVAFEVVTLRRNELDTNREARPAPYGGWRIWAVDRHELKKGEFDGEVDFDRLGYAWSPEWKPVPNVSPSLDGPAAIAAVSSEEE